MNKGVESGILVYGCEETSGGNGAIVIRVKVVLGEGGGEGTNSLKV